MLYSRHQHCSILDTSTPSTSTDPPATPPYHKPSSSVATAAVDGESLSYTAALSQELVKFQQELDDQKLSVTEFKKIRDDLHRRIHDQKFAEEIMRIPEDEWEDWGGDFERPFGEGSSKSVNAKVFRVYF
nr:putative E3 ubiquitin ligase [Ipomoea batatas]